MWFFPKLVLHSKNGSVFTGPKRLGPPVGCGGQAVRLMRGPGCANYAGTRLCGLCWGSFQDMGEAIDLMMLMVIWRLLVNPNLSYSLIALSLSVRECRKGIPAFDLIRPARCRMSVAAYPLPRWSGCVQTALISIKGLACNLYPAIATNRSARNIPV